MPSACVDNRIGADGVQAIAEALRVNQTVAQIDLKSMCRSDDGEHAWDCTDLSRACVGNKIGVEGARVLAEALKRNQTLARIDLSSKCGS